MKYFLIIKRNNEHYQIATELGEEIWSDMTEKKLKDIIENWFYRREEKDVGK